jgi:sugar phosphate isomerase/epimerase
MNFSVCVYPETAQELLDRTGAETALELQSFGLKGVKSAQAWNERAEFYRAFARAHRDRTFHLHGPFLDLPWWTYDHLIEDVVRRRVTDTIDLCADIRPVHLVMHLSCPAYFCRPARAALWSSRALDFWHPHLTRLADVGVHTVFENTAEPDPSASLAFADAIAAAFAPDPAAAPADKPAPTSFPSTPASICLDIGHAHAFSPTPPLDWVRSLGHRIAHYHIHDNDTTDDWHRAPGEGTIDFAALLPEIARLSPDATLSMEVETGPDATLEALDFINDWGQTPLGFE